MILKIHNINYITTLVKETEERKDSAMDHTKPKSMYFLNMTKNSTSCLLSHTNASIILTANS